MSDILQRLERAAEALRRNNGGYHSKECDDAKAEIEQLRALIVRKDEALNNATFSMKHATIFIESREKMHPDGQALWREDVSKMIDALRLTPEDMRGWVAVQRDILSRALQKPVDDEDPWPAHCQQLLRAMIGRTK